jgi:hypothetical protein
MLLVQGIRHIILNEQPVRECDPTITVRASETRKAGCNTLATSLLQYLVCRIPRCFYRCHCKDLSLNSGPLEFMSSDGIERNEASIGSIANCYANE